MMQLLVLTGIQFTEGTGLVRLAVVSESLCLIISKVLEETWRLKVLNWYGLRSELLEGIFRSAMYVYRPPRSSNEWMDSMHCILDQALQEKLNVTLLGDFNCNRTAVQGYYVA